MAANNALPGSLLAKFSNLQINSGPAIVISARKGLESSVFYDFATAIKMSEKFLAQLLNLSSRTVSNYKAQKKNLEPLQSEHLLKLIALYGKGEEVFGNVDEFNYWLQKASWDNQEKPIDWLITPGGVDLVSDEIDRLAHGYAV